MDNKIIDKFLKFIQKEVGSNIKKDFKWFSKTIAEDLEKITQRKNKSKKKDE